MRAHRGGSRHVGRMEAIDQPPRWLFQLRSRQTGILHDYDSRPMARHAWTHVATGSGHAAEPTARVDREAATSARAATAVARVDARGNDPASFLKSARELKWGVTVVIMILPLPSGPVFVPDRSTLADDQGRIYFPAGRFWTKHRPRYETATIRQGESLPCS
jgi:hypothetical protein